MRDSSNILIGKQDYGSTILPTPTGSREKFSSAAKVVATTATFAGIYEPRILLLLKRKGIAESSPSRGELRERCVRDNEVSRVSPYPNDPSNECGLVSV